MNRLVRAIALATVPLTLGVPATALACTPAPGYRVPTNLELAEEANLIVLGEVVSAAPAREDDPLSAGIVVEPITALKGLLPSGSLVLRGMALAAPDRPEEAVRSDPNELVEAHPLSRTGACIRRVFPQGARVLFFLTREGGDWVPAGGPFSRWAEDVTSRDAPWAQLALLYGHASLLPPEERTALLQDQIDALQARRESETALAMATNIERQLAGPNEPLFPEAETAEADKPEMAPEIGEFREPDELTAVQRALDAMKADKE